MQAHQFQCHPPAHVNVDIDFNTTDDVISVNCEVSGDDPPASVRIMTSRDIILTTSKRAMQVTLNRSNGEIAKVTCEACNVIGCLNETTAVTSQPATGDATSGLSSTFRVAPASGYPVYFLCFTYLYLLLS